jgi:tetratricopeptide (TPR) repeat protein
MLTNLGQVYQYQGDLDRAEQHHRQALSTFKETGDRAGEADAHNGLGEVRYATGAPADALVEHEAALTIATRSERVEIELGVIESADGFVNNYIEKPKLRYDVSMGIYVYDSRALRHLPEGMCQFPELVLRLLAAGERVATYVSDAEWFDIGTLSEYERASAAVADNPEAYGLDLEVAPPPPALYPVGDNGLVETERRKRILGSNGHAKLADASSG